MTKTEKTLTQEKRVVQLFPSKWSFYIINWYLSFETCFLVFVLEFVFIMSLIAYNSSIEIFIILCMYLTIVIAKRFQSFSFLPFMASKMIQLMSAHDHFSSHIFSTMKNCSSLRSMKKIRKFRWSMFSLSFGNFFVTSGNEWFLKCLVFVGKTYNNSWCVLNVSKRFQTKTISRNFI